MAVTDFTEIGALNKYPENINLLTDVRFRFVIRKIPNVNFFCQSVKLPSIRLASPEQPTPFQNIPLAGISLDYDELQVTFLVDEDMKNYFEIVKWMNGLGMPKNFDQYASLKTERMDLSAKYGGLWSDAVIHILDNQSNPNVNIIFKEAFPVYLSQLEFSNNKLQSEPLVAIAEFRYIYYDYEYCMKDPTNIEWDKATDVKWTQLNRTPWK